MLKVGIAKIDITPPLGSRLAGYPDPERLAEEIHDPLFATAIVFEQGSAKAVHVTMDVVQVENDDIASMRKLASEKAKIPADHINIGVIHTHSGPQTMSFEGWGDKDEKYLETLIPRVAQVVWDAAAKTSPVSVGFATTETKVGINRRSIPYHNDHKSFSSAVSIFDDNPYDSTMTVVRFEGNNGPVATLIHCSGHGTAMGLNRLISRDWPGVMIDRVESQIKSPVIFINGSYGDTGPRTNRLISPGIFGGGDGIHAVNEVGYRGATDALWAHQSIKHYFKDIKLNVLVEDIQLSTAPLPSIEEAMAKLKEWEPLKDKWGQGMCEYRYWERVIEANKEKPKTSIPFRQTIINLGPLVLVPFPGEPFSTIALRLRKFSPFQYTIACGGTNGMYGYFPDRESRQRGGYETRVSIGTLTWLLADNIDDVLVSENLKLLEKIMNVS